MHRLKPEIAIKALGLFYGYGCVTGEPNLREECIFKCFIYIPLKLSSVH